MIELRSNDDAQAQLHRDGWSAGDVVVRTSAGLVWIAYAHRGEQQIVAKAPRQTEAWREAVRLAPTTLSISN